MRLIEERLRRQIDAMPPLPGVALQILELVRDVEFEMPELVRLVRTDPALSSSILRLCNSSLFAKNTRITSVEQGLSYLGIRNIVRVVVAACTSKYFRFARRSGPYLHPDDIWSHGIACATACQILAPRVGLEPGLAFTTGILHNLGKVVLAHSDADRRPPCRLVPKGEHASLDSVERALWGTDHARVNGFVGEAWNLPADMVAAMRGHHDPFAIEEDGPLTAVLHVADLVTLRADIGGLPRPGTPLRVLPIALERLEMTEGDLGDATDEMTTEFLGAEELVNMR